MVFVVTYLISHAINVLVPETHGSTVAGISEAP